MFTKRGGKGSVAQYLRRTSLDNILGPALAPVSQWLRAFQRSQLMAERERIIWQESIRGAETDSQSVSTSNQNNNEITSVDREVKL